MKRAIMLAAVSAVLLTGCGEDTQETSSDYSSVNSAVTTAADEEAPAGSQQKKQLEFRIGTDPGSEPVLTNEHVSEAYRIYVDEGGDKLWAVQICFNEEGTQKFAEITGELAGTDTPVSIWLDGELISAPMVSGAITDGKAVITGNFSAESSEELARAISPAAEIKTETEG